MGCRLDKARAWALRLHLEGQQHSRSCFITLTYDEEFIPYGNSLLPDDLSRFIKRLRKHLSPDRIRYYGVGEYGGTTERPHYHAIIFGYDFPDRSIYIDRGDYTIDNSGILTKLWPFGHATVQTNTLETAAYVAKYAVKKITGEKAKEHYQRIDTETGELYQRFPEFARMSTRPGIGKDWLKKYHKDLYPKGYVTNGKGQKMAPPEYFNKLYEKWFPEQFKKMRDENKEENFKRYKEANEDRLIAREKIQTKFYNLKKVDKL